MQKILVLAAFGLMFSPAFASAPPSPPPAERALHGSECLDPAFARGFTPMDDRHLLVDAGRRHYLLELESSCWNLDFANFIAFRGDPISQRVCGSFNDAVLFRNEHPCRIHRMSLLSKDEYRAALKDRAAWRKAQRSTAKPKG